jgi:hypothetical protein
MSIEHMLFEHFNCTKSLRRVVVAPLIDRNMEVDADADYLQGGNQPNLEVPSSANSQ